MVNKTKQQPTEKQIFTNPMSDRGLISKMYKEIKKLYIKIPNSTIKNGTDLNENSQQKNMKWKKNI